MSEKNMHNLIDTLHLEDLSNEAHPSIFDDNDGYNMLIARIPVIDHNVLLGKSLGFILTQDKSYFYDKKKQSFEELDDVFLGVHAMIDKEVDKLLKSFLNYQEIVSDMEENLYAQDTDESFLKSWLSIKLEILRIERTLNRTTHEMGEFIEYYQNLETFPINSFIDLNEHMERTMRSGALQLSKLDYLYSFYNAKSNDKMNKMIYILTIISAIFLPLNLVVGFFGMNTSSLPFAQGTGGTYYAISLMLTLVVISTIIFQIWKKKV